MAEQKTVTPVIAVAGKSVYDIPEACDSLLHKMFSMQREYSNESEYRTFAIEESLRMAAKYEANAAINDWERLIAKCQKQHAEFDRNTAIDFLRKTRTGRELEELATVATAVKTELS
jgi:hypothetical protein